MKGNKNIKKIKDNLFNIINKIGSKATWFSKKPGIYFIRNRKLDLITILKFMFFMEGNTLNTEIMKYFNFNENIPSSSALIEQRKKIHLDTFKYIFKKFTNIINVNKTYKGYRLLACDGSNLNYACDKKDKTTYIKHPISYGRGHNSLHLNVLYDLENNIYIDTDIQNKKEMNEAKSLNKMVSRLNIQDDVIIIADRGYESYNVFANIENNNYKYLVRAKDINSNGILSSLSLPNTEFDKVITLTLTRKQNKRFKDTIHNYKFLPINCTFDFLNDENIFYPITLRIVRFKLSNNNYECIITNLDPNEFTPYDIKELYHLRWGIETSFRELKYNIGLINFHSKNKEFILQEIYIKLILYNFCQSILSQISVKQKDTKYLYEIDISTAFLLCKKYLKDNNFNTKRLTNLILKHLHPIRLGRSDKRKLRTKGYISFTYRIAA